MAPTPRPARLVRGRPLSRDVRELTFQLQQEPPPRFEAGQWAAFHVPTGEPPPRVRPYSLAAPANDRGTLTIAVDRRFGPEGAAYLMQMAEGETIPVALPFGQFIVNDSEGDLLLVGRAAGLSPLRAILLDRIERKDPRGIVLVAGAEPGEEILWRDEFEAIAGAWPQVRFLAATEGDEIEAVRAVAAERRRWLPFLAGARAAVLPVRDALIGELGLSPADVRTELYD